jgi:hypothetical protein
MDKYNATRELHIPAEPEGRACLTAAKQPKRRYPTRALAKDAATKFLRPYLCPSCAGWHLTSTR